MAREYQNKIIETVMVAKNRTKQNGEPFYSLRKVSDNLTVCDVFQGMGQGKAAMNWQINITANTKIMEGVTLDPLTSIDVSGRFAYDVSEANGKKYPKFIIWADTISATKESEDAPAGINPAFAQGGIIPTAAAPADATAPNIDDILPLSSDDAGSTAKTTNGSADAMSEFINCDNVDDLPFN